MVKITFQADTRKVVARMNRIITNFPKKAMRSRKSMMEAVKQQANKNVDEKAWYRRKGQWSGMLQNSWFTVEAGQNQSILINTAPHAQAIEIGDAKIIGPHQIVMPSRKVINHPGVGGGSPPSPLIKHFAADAVRQVQASGKFKSILKQQKFVE